jgi:hypothetical protein
VDEALSVARDCQASAWWCAALEGFLLHEVGQVLEAEEVFLVALREMPPQTRCEWSDAMSVLLQGGLADAFNGTSCLARDAIERRIWWLSDPFYLIPGNDRATEHFARLVGWKFNRDGARTGTKPAGGARLRAAIVAHGFGELWWGAEGGHSPSQNPGDHWGYGFIPLPSAWANPGASSRADWELVLRDRDLFAGRRREVELGLYLPRSGDVLTASWDDRYLPSYPVYADLPDQTAFFSRGDTFAVAAAVDLSRHPLAIRRPVQLGAVFARDENDPPTITWGVETEDRYLVRATIPAEPHLVSIEAIGADGGAARVRFGHTLPRRSPDAPGLSDLLLFDWEDGLPERLEAVAPRMLGSTEITSDRDVGVFWEIYGLAAGEQSQVSISVVPEDAGLLRRLGQFLRLVEPIAALSIEWREELEEAEIAGRTLRVDLSALPPGNYTLELSVRARDGQEVTALRGFQRREVPK